MISAFMYTFHSLCARSEQVMPFHLHVSFPHHFTHLDGKSELLNCGFSLQAVSVICNNCFIRVSNRTSWM